MGLFKFYWTDATNSFKTPTQISVDTNLFTLAHGFYFAQGNVSTDNNWPFTGYFMGLIEKRGTTDGTGPNYHAALTLWNENDCREYNNICKYSGWGGWSITYTTKDRPTASDVNAPTIEEFNSLKTSSLKTTSISVNTYQISFYGSWNTVYSCFGRTNNNRFSIIGFPNNANIVTGKQIGRAHV